MVERGEAIAMKLLASLAKPGAFCGGREAPTHDEIALVCLQAFHGQVGDGFPEGERAIDELAAMRRIVGILNGAYTPARPESIDDAREPFIPDFLR